MIPVEITPLPTEGQIQVLWKSEDEVLYYDMYKSSESFLASIPDGQAYVSAMGW